MNIDLSNRMLGDLVLARLTSVSDRPLPEEGFIAGGAVASVLLSIADGQEGLCPEYPVNDIDIFVASAGRVEAEHTFHGTESAIGMEYEALFTYTNRGYGIGNVKRDGLLNSIDVFHVDQHGGWSATDPATIAEGYHEMTTLAGFDINATQVGVDIKSKRIYCTKHFELFLHSRQLQVANASTPFHTVIRLAKKAYEMKCYVDLKHEVKMLATYADIARLRSVRSSTPRFLGEKHIKSYQQFRDQIGQYCTASPVPDRDGFWELTFRDDISIAHEFEQRFRALGVCVPESVTAFVNAWDLLYRPTTRNAERRVFQEALSYGNSYVAQASMAHRGFISPDYSPKQARMVHKYMKGHSAAIGTLLGSNIGEQYRTIKMLEGLGEDGLLVVGVLETQQTDFNRIPAPLTHEWVKGYVADYKSRFSGALVEPIDLLAFEHRASVRELVSDVDLRVEGARMCHCVGGYAGEVKDGYSRIFHIEVNGRHSTLEVCYGSRWSNSELLPYIHQQRGKRNADVSPEESRVAKDLLAYLRIQWLLTVDADVFLGKIGNLTGMRYRRFVYGMKNWFSRRKQHAVRFLTQILPKRPEPEPELEWCPAEADFDDFCEEDEAQPSEAYSDRDCMGHTSLPNEFWSSMSGEDEGTDPF